MFLIGTTVFWISMMSLHVDREYFELKPVYAPYQVLPLHNLYLREEYRGIYLGESLIGFTLTVLERMEEPGEQHEAAKPEAGAGADKGAPQGKQKVLVSSESLYELRHHSYMTFRFLGQEREMLIRSKALLNSRLEMKGFAMKVMSGEYATEIEGHLVRGSMELMIREKGSEPVHKTVPVPSPLYYSESLSMLWTPENLKTGRKGRIQVWNPIALTADEIDFRVGERVPIRHEGKDVETYVITITEKGMETHYWVTPEGILLKHESATGLVLEKKDAWKIFEALRQTRGALLDLPNLYSTPSNTIIQSPGQLNGLTARLVTPDGEKVLEIRRPAAPMIDGIRIPSLAGNPELAPYLAPDEFIQSDNEEIRGLAAKITAGEDRVWQAAVRIMDWVHGYVQPTPTVSLPSALQVLKLKRGDCNEYTVLYTALARAAGIPAKMMAGLVYQNGRFFYHAWPEIYAGEWIPVDPTFGEAPADVTHLPLVEGNLKEQADLVSRLGKITVTILKTE